MCYNASMNSDIIRSTRKLHGLSSSQLAYKLGVSQSTVIRYEQSEKKGTISINTLKKLALALGYQLEYQLRPIEQTKSIKNESISSGRTTNYHGLKRMLRKEAPLDYAPSLLAQKMKDDVSTNTSTLTKEEKIILTCELSDFALSLKNV